MTKLSVSAEIGIVKKMMSKKCNKVLLGLIFTAFLCIIIYQFSIQDHVIYQEISVTKQELFVKKQELSIISKMKTVLLVNPAFWGMKFQEGRLGFIDAGCDVSNCFLTTNHSYVNDYNFDAFMLHVPTQWKNRWRLPNRRKDQIFIFFSTEPPTIMPPLGPFNNYFNWTMTYFAKSDIHLPYGRIEPLPGAPTTEAERLKVREQVRQFRINPALGKSKLAIWTVSNCKAGSNRMDYVKELQKYIDIDVFSKDGKCGEAGCPRNKNNECLDDIEKTYKFYLAFENSICREYVTEKFYNSIGRNLVPIVLGGANYSAIAPKHSYINALDYTPRQLAEYLQQLDQDDSLYAEYFWWKPYYRVLNLVQMNQIAFCKLCAALHDNPAEEKIVRDVKNWYINDSQCIDRPNLKLLWSIKDAVKNETNDKLLSLLI